MLKWQNETQAVISLVSPVSAKHWGEYVEEHWAELTQGISGEFRMMVMAGVHGGIAGEIGDAIAKNIEDIKNRAVFNFVAHKINRFKDCKNVHTFFKRESNLALLRLPSEF